MGKFNFGKSTSDKKTVKVPEAQVIIKEVYVDRIVEVPIEVIKEITVEKIITVEKLVEVIKEVPVVITKIELVEIDRIIEVPVEKVVTIIDKSLLFEEKQKNTRLQIKIRRLYLALACMITISIIIGVI